jgi:hypothetical protein
VAEPQGLDDPSRRRLTDQAEALEVAQSPLVSPSGLQSTK